MRWRIPLVAVLALFVAVSCDQQPVSPLGDQVVDAPTFKIGDGPTESGIVFRGEYNNAYSWVDTKRGMRVAIGLDMVEYCAGTIDFDVLSFLDISVPGRPLLGPAYGEDMRTAVWDFTEFDCALFATVPPVATGYSDLINTDNDLFGVAEEDNNANAWGIRAHGTLTLESGADAAFSAHLNMRFNWSNGYRETAKISLH